MVRLIVLFVLTTTAVSVAVTWILHDAVEKVEKQRELLINNIANYEDAKYALDHTYAPYAPIFFNNHLVATGPKEFLPLFWAGTEGSKVVIVHHNLTYKEDVDTVFEEFKSYTIKNGDSKAILGTRYWKQQEHGNFQIVMANYTETVKIHE